VLGPDVQKSVESFSIETPAHGKEAIRFGLRAVKNVGDEAATGIIAAREKDGPFKSLEDFCARVDSHQVNKKTVESLIKAGALDCLCPKKSPPRECRARLLAGFEGAMSIAAEIQKEASSAQGSLFGQEEHLRTMSVKKTGKEIVPLNEHLLLQDEKEVLGFYISGHPLSRYKDQLKMLASHTVEEILGSAAKDAPGEDGAKKKPSGGKGQEVRLAGLVAQLQRKQSKKKEPWAQFWLEDLTNGINVMIFPKNYAKFGKSVASNSIVVVEGRINYRTDTDIPEPEIFAENVIPIHQAFAKWGKHLIVTLPAASVSQEQLEKLEKVLDNHHGYCPVYIKLGVSGSEDAMIATAKRVELSRQLLEKIEAVAGEHSWLVSA